jgi:hypothetical protein
MSFLGGGSPGSGGGSLPGIDIPIFGGGAGGSSNPNAAAKAIFDGSITDPTTIQQALQNPMISGTLASMAQSSSMSFNPTNIPTWMRILAMSVPAIASIVAKINSGDTRPVSVIAGTAKASSPSTGVTTPTTPTTPTIPANPRIPGATPVITTPSPSTATTPSAMPTAPATTNIAGQPLASNAILPGEVPPINPSLQTAWNNFLTQNVGTGVPQYPGQLSATPNANLTGTWGAFNPDVTKTPGASYIQQMLSSGALSNPSQVNPILAQMMKTGSPSGASPLAPYAAQTPGYLAPFLMQGVPGYQAPTIP